MPAINLIRYVDLETLVLDPPTIDLDWTTGTISMSNANVDNDNHTIGTIYYTTDNSTPTTNSTIYTQPFVITSATTFKMIVATNEVSSVVAQKVYQKISTPSITGVTQNWSYNRGYVNYSSSVPNANSAYRTTNDGTTPTYNSTVSSGSTRYDLYNNTGSPITYKIRAFYPDMVPSDTTSRTVGYGTPTAPSITYDQQTEQVSMERAGEAVGHQNLYINASDDNKTDGFHIFYTLDGSNPTTSSNRYRGPFTVNSTTTIKAIIVAYGEYSSDVNTLTVTI